jgi:hypothetical protein
VSKFALNLYSWGSVIAFVAISGCNSTAPPKVTQTVESNLKAIHVFFGQYSAQHQGRPPANEQAFRGFLKSLPAERLESMAVSNMDSLFVSPRDNQPIVVLYNQPASMPGVGTTKLLAHETTGVNGQRFVLLTTGEIQEVDQARFDELKK